jgi:hypothetical protein
MELRTPRENSESVLDLEKHSGILHAGMRENIMPIDVKLSPVVEEPHGGVSKDWPMGDETTSCIPDWEIA